MPQVYLNLQTWVNLLILSRVSSHKKKIYSALAYLCNTLWNFSPKNRRLNEPVVLILSFNSNSYYWYAYIFATCISTRLIAYISLDLKWDILKESYFRMLMYISWCNSYCLDRQWKSLYGARTARELTRGLTFTSDLCGFNVRTVVREDTRPTRRPDSIGLVRAIWIIATAPFSCLVAP